ncbi:MAG: CoA transferase, partial [Boseongicola sp. SB0670_bin_30]|nr:CoA transferase [Boseongicola sp. SB0670_bin_30]
IVCAHCSGYGREGPRREWPGYDYLMQAETGYFHLTGEPEAPPTRVGMSVVDFMAGTYMALGLVAGVLSARSTGQGRDIDVNLYDTALYNLSYLNTWALNSGYDPLRVPRSAHVSLVPCQLYRTSDGWIYVMCNKEKFWPELCEAVGRPDLARDPRFATYADRLDRRDELTVILDEALSARTSDAWLCELRGRVPVAPIRTPRAALQDSRLEAEEKIETLALDGSEEFRMLRSPIRAGGNDASRACPPMGHDTVEILQAAGYSAEDIAGFRERSLI